MSKPYEYLPAAQVLQTDLHNHILKPLTTSFSITKYLDNISKNELGTSLVLCCSGRSLEKSGSSALQLVGDDSLQSHAAVSLDSDLKSAIISQRTLDEKALEMNHSEIS